MSADGAVADSPSVPSAWQKRMRPATKRTACATGKTSSCQSFVSVRAKTSATPPPWMPRHAPHERHGLASVGRVEPHAAVPRRGRPVVEDVVHRRRRAPRHEAGDARVGVERAERVDDAARGEPGLLARVGVHADGLRFTHWLALLDHDRVDVARAPAPPRDGRRHRAVPEGASGLPAHEVEDADDHPPPASSRVTSRRGGSGFPRPRVRS